MRVLLLLLPLLGLIDLAQSISMARVVLQEWETFKAHHGKKYSTKAEDNFRMKVWQENTYTISARNAKFHANETTYKLKMNHFGDLLPHEFRTHVNGYKRSLRSLTARRAPQHPLPPADLELPKHVDWRAKGVVTPVKDQGMCGSCWAFSATGALEGQHARTAGKLVSLSEQNLVDCSTAYGNNGCNGGLMDNAFRYIRDNGGIDTETGYPYHARDENCTFHKSDIGAEDTGFIDIPSGNEHALKAALATVGPVSVAIDASNPSFQFYHHGVYFEENCSPDNLDHGVLAVGYNTAKKSGKDYWIVKNSWSEKWGLDGYIHMARNKDNNCGIASAASYPLV